MPVMLAEQSVAAGVSVANLFTGQPYEIQRGNVYLSIGIAQSVTGGFMSIFSGSDIIMTESSPPILTRYPIIPDEMYFNDVATIADRLVVGARNPTGGAIIFRSIAQITNL